VANPEIVVLAPVPVVVMPSGLRVKVQVPALGKSFKTIVPVETVQVGCVSVPTEGVVGIPPPSLLIVILVVGEGDVQFVLFITEKV
jgi:hypothetical protein